MATYNYNFGPMSTGVTNAIHVAVPKQPVVNHVYITTNYTFSGDVGVENTTNSNNGTFCNSTHSVCADLNGDNINDLITSSVYIFSWNGDNGIGVLVKSFDGVIDYAGKSGHHFLGTSTVPYSLGVVPVSLLNVFVGSTGTYSLPVWIENLINLSGTGFASNDFTQVQGTITVTLT